MEDSNAGRELSVSVLITKALDSLWDVARRRYLGESGAITYVSKAAVEMAVYATTMQAMDLLKRATHELIKLKPDGTVDGTDHQVVGYHIPREWSIRQRTPLWKFAVSLSPPASVTDSSTPPAAGRTYPSHQEDSKGGDTGG